MANMEASYPYQEPEIITVIVLTAFLLLLNAVNFAFDRLVYCGLLGQILVGVWFGSPGAQWLSTSFELIAQQLGYLGLILVVYEGGLNTSPKALKSSLVLSSVVALTGIGAPIALSFVLKCILDITNMQAFAAGAALCSTSLGTTLTVLTTSGLTKSRLGIVLTSAAIMDDVVGLIMVQVISELRTVNRAFSATTVIRPVFVSIAYAVVIPIMSSVMVRPTLHWYGQWSKITSQTSLVKYLATSESHFAVQILILVAMVSSATYAGTSGLFAAYIAGAFIAWSDGCAGLTWQRNPQVSKVEPHNISGDVTMTPATRSPGECASGSVPQPNDPSSPIEEVSYRPAPSSTDVYHKYMAPSVDSVLKPFFFASIGFSIPITRMFQGNIVWRGIIYTVLMFVGKFLCGIWLLPVRIDASWIPRITHATVPRMAFRTFCLWCGAGTRTKSAKPLSPSSKTPQGSPVPNAVLQDNKAKAHSKDQPAESNARSAAAKSSLSEKPLSLYPSTILGSAMVARGEIGFLISSIAQSSNIYTDELFLIVTWAVFLCTFIGPVLVGFLVRRVNTLQKGERDKRSGKKDPLGIWGVSESTL